MKRTWKRCGGGGWLAACTAGLLVLATAAGASGDTLAQWTFETSQPAGSGQNNGDATHWEAEIGLNANNPNTLASGFHASSATAWSSPAGNGSLHSYSSNNWGVSDYYQFRTSTTGYQNIQVEWDQAGSSTGPRDFQFQYSTDGTAFTTVGGTRTILLIDWVTTGSPHTAFHFTVDLSSVTALNSAAAVYFRLRCSSGTAINGSGIATGGTDRVNNFTISGTVPPPIGSCCFHDGSCVAGVTQANCNGDFWTNGGTCSGECIQPNGSCCHADGSCTVTQQANCSGTWTIDGTCTPNTCPQPPVDCVVSDWGPWSACSAPCGGGTQTRTRTVLVPPANGGAPCPSLIETQPCNTQPCPVDCVVSDWSDWSACSAPCGGGTQTRTRTVIIPPAFGGQPCPTLTETRSCNEQPCPVDCVVSDWSDWSACSAPCGGGTQTRTRTILVPPANGGAPCPTLTETQSCNTQACAETLTLAFDHTCYKPGDTVTATLSMAGLPSPAAGFQAFLSFDTSHLNWVSTTYTASPFLEHILSGTPSGANIDVAAGVRSPQSPSQADALLVTFVFTAGGSDNCSLSGALIFRNTGADPPNPSTRITDANGVALTPLTKNDAPTISIDSTAPTATQGSIAACYQTVAAANAAALAATTALTDNCDTSPTKAVQTGAGSCDTTITIRVQDSCGNYTDYGYDTRVDGTPPTATQGTINACYPDAASANAAALAATTGLTDYCVGYSPWVTKAVQTGAGSCDTSIVIRVTDLCGNYTDYTYNTCVDGTAPTITSCPTSSIDLGCNPTEPTCADAKGQVSFSDNCGGTMTKHCVAGSVDSDGCHRTQGFTITGTDDCNNESDPCVVTYTWDHVTAPVISGCPSGPIDLGCNPTLPTCADQTITASNECGAVTVNCSPGSITSNGCHRSQSFTYTASACSLSATPCVVTYTWKADTTPPEITVPDPINVNADAGVCTASVSFSASANDTCDGPTAITFWDGATQIFSPHIFSGGTTTVTVKASDSCGNPGSATFDVTVSAFNDMLVNVQLGGAGYPASLKRCITFELYSCPNATEVSQQITFTSGVATNVHVLVPCGSYSCVTARDKLHTLRRTLTPAISGTQYTASFTGDPGTGGDWLIGGNLNDDYYIDILDFGTFVGQYGACYGAGCPGTPSGDTTCSTAYPHADISGNGTVGTPDFTFIQVNFLKVNEANCCNLPNIAGRGPITDISVAELRAMGLGNLAIADLNRDGRLNQQDIAAWMLGVRPKVTSPGSK